jgi:hypothetical protein
MKNLNPVALLLFLLLGTGQVLAETITCSIEKSLSTGQVLEEPMVSTQEARIEIKPFGTGYLFSLSPAEAECELRVPNPRGGSFLNCWTLDKKHGFRSDRTAINERKGAVNTLSYADDTKQVVVKVTVKCK